MKPTKVTNLLLAALAAGVAAFLVAKYLVSRGQTVPVSDYNVMFTLPAVALVLALFAIPIWRYRKQTLKLSKNQPVEIAKPKIKRVDPFYAVRVVLLAKATALASALFIGWHIGLIALQIGGPELTTGFYKNLITLIGAVIAMVIALIIEWICRIPETPDELEKKAKPATGQIDVASLGKTESN